MTFGAGEEASWTTIYNQVDEIKKLKAQISRLEIRNERLVEALEFYAEGKHIYFDQEGYMQCDPCDEDLFKEKIDDRGEVARQALAEVEHLE